MLTLEEQHRLKQRNEQLERELQQREREHEQEIELLKRQIEQRHRYSNLSG